MSLIHRIDSTPIRNVGAKRPIVNEMRTDQQERSLVLRSADSNQQTKTRPTAEHVGGHEGFPDSHLSSVLHAIESAAAQAAVRQFARLQCARFTRSGVQ